MKQLRLLELRGCYQITDAGLKEVAKLKQLRELYFAGTKITKVGVAELQKALPKCKILKQPQEVTAPNPPPSNSFSALAILMHVLRKQECWSYFLS